MNDLKEEITCRIAYYRQLCNDNIVPINLLDYYRGCADSLHAILTYMEEGVNYERTEI